MNKFKVGDKVYRLVDRKEANVLWEISEVQVMKIGDKEHYNYILKAEGDFSAGAKHKHAFLNFEEYLELYKTPHERLLELGFIISDETVYHISYMLKELDITIFKKEKTYQAYSYGDNYNPINLQLAEILVDYLKELENDI